MSGSQQDVAQDAICVPKGLAGLGTILRKHDWGRLHPGRCSSVRQAFAVHGCIESYQRLAFNIYYPILAVQVTASFSYCEPLTFELDPYVPGAKIIVPKTGASSNGFTSKWEVGYVISCRPLEPHALCAGVGLLTTTNSYKK